MSVEIIKAERGHLNYIALRMRAADRAEVTALGSNPKRSLRNGMAMSMRPLTVMVDGNPAGMFGCVPRSLLDSVGVPWMLGTEALYQRPADWALLGPRYVADMLTDFRILENVVGASNVRAIRFLRYLGFDIGREPMAVGGLDFLSFRYAIQDEARAA